jgi:hypothetical protein
MNKKLILVLVIAVALVATWSFAMHSKKAPVTKKAEKAAEVTLEEMPALPHTGEVKRMPLDQALQERPTRTGKTLTATDPAEFKQHIIENSYQIPFDAEIKHITPLGEVPERSMTECLVYVHDYETCCWLYVAFDDELWGWGGISMKTWQDPQADPEHSACGYPIYPFAVKGVEVFISAPTACTLFCSFDIQEFDWWYNTPYPGETIWESPIYAFAHPGAYAYLGAALPESLCMYDRYFASWTFYNTDDYDPEGLEWCNHPDDVWVHAGQDTCIYSVDTVAYDCVEPPNPDEDSCLVSVDPDVYGHYENVVTDTLWGYLPPYDFGLNVLWDQGGMAGKTYWSYGYYWTIGYWWDVVADLPAFGMGWPGAVRIRSWGKVVDQNDCPIPEDAWWQKEPFFEYDEGTETVLAYAPCGVPDFDQKFKEAAHPEIDAPWDGPTALANCLWWMVAADKLDDFWSEYCGFADMWDPQNPPCVINYLADFMEFGDCGVGPDEFDAGLDALVEEYVLWVDIKEMHQPTFEFIEYECRICEDVILLLGFWYPEVVAGEPPETTWYRVGGHWVTVAGVDHINGKIKISDPDLDWAEMMGWTDFVCSFEYYLAHDHGTDPYCHFDAGNVSHDPYAIAPSITPCGVLMIPDYPYYELDMAKYLGHNNNPYCPGEVATEYEGQPIFVEIEFAKAISPIPPYMCETIWAYRGADMWTGMVKCNYGDLMARDDYGFYWDPYGLAGFDGSIILGNDPSNLAFFGGDNDPPGEFFPYGGVEYGFYMKDGYTLPDGSAGQVGVNTLTTNYFHNYGLDLDVDMTAVAFDDTVGYGAGNGVWDVYTITNTGTTAYTGLRFAIWYDWDLLDDGYLDASGADPDVSFGWIYNTAAHPDTVFGNLILTDGPISAERFLGVVNPTYVHPNAGWGWDRDSLWNVMNGDDHNSWNTSGGPDDMSSIMTTAPFDLQVGQSVTIASWTGEPPPEPARSFITAEMYYIGHFRGDVNMDCIINPPDIVYTVNYVFKSGPPAKPFEDHGDCNDDGVVNAADIVYQVNYVFKSGPVPVDYARFTEIPFTTGVGAFDPGHPLYNLCQ